MDRALVEHAEDDIDRDQGSQDQDGRAAERALESLRVALEAGSDRGWQVEIGGGLADRRHRTPDSAVGGEVEAQSDRWELALVVDRERSDRGGDGASWLSGTVDPLADFA
jgi:hypothetical protein